MNNNEKVMEYFLLLFWVFITSSEGYFGKNYLSCERERCRMLSDKETDFQFDQPQLVKVEGAVLQELESTDRLGVDFKCARGVEREIKEEEEDGRVNTKIHMIWLGSPLPFNKFSHGIFSFVTLNPDYEVILWLDHPESAAAISSEVTVKDVSKEDWQLEDLLENCTNYAQKADILRLEIVYSYGGIYVDMDTTALRPFGPIFRHSFLSYRPQNWFKSFVNISTSNAGIQTNIFGFPRHSPFLRYVLEALRENFYRESSTLRRTGPFFLKEALVQYPHSGHISVMDWDYVGGDGSSTLSIVMDTPGCHWDDNQDVRKKKTEV